MDERRSLDDLVAERLPRLSKSEAKVARLFRDHRDDLLLSSAAMLAETAGTSDATVIRTARALGFRGMGDLRRFVADEAKRAPSQSDRLVATLAEVGNDPGQALDATLAIHAESFAALRRDIPRGLFVRAVAFLAEARRVVAFGIGPTSCIADYLSMQLGRFGLSATSMTRTGLLAADDLVGLRADDAVVVFAYGRPYREVAALLDEARRLDLGTMLVTDTPGSAERDRPDLVLVAPRGRTDRLGLHTGTMALVEALLVGVAASRSEETLKGLERLDRLRARLTGTATAPKSGEGRGLGQKDAGPTVPPRATGSGPAGRHRRRPADSS